MRPRARRDADALLPMACPDAPDLPRGTATPPAVTGQARGAAPVCPSPLLEGFAVGVPAPALAAGLWGRPAAFAQPLACLVLCRRS